jgi:putative Holliday junction resolvase|tara:strand:- start:228 stop:653 length:426 start_codon:yes stop_codon:yes gene_type:complete
MADKFYLGIDYGIKKTGIAIAQKVTKKSRPLKIVYKDYIDEIGKILEEWDIDKIVVGFPDHVGKKASKIQGEINNFVNTLKKNINPSIEVILFDEQLSSELAKNDFAEMRNLGFTRKKNSDYDDISASIILQSWINENIMD